MAKELIAPLSLPDTPNLQDKYLGVLTLCMVATDTYGTVSVFMIGGSSNDGFKWSSTSNRDTNRIFRWVGLAHMAESVCFRESDRRSCPWLSSPSIENDGADFDLFDPRCPLSILLLLLFLADFRLAMPFTSTKSVIGDFLRTYLTLD